MNIKSILLIIIAILLLFLIFHNNKESITIIKDVSDIFVND
jgi:hypothetical protein